MMRRSAGGSWSTSSRAPGRTARARSSPRRSTRSAPKPPGRGDAARRRRARRRRAAPAARPARIFRRRPAGGFGPGARRGEPRCRRSGARFSTGRRGDPPLRRDPSSGNRRRAPGRAHRSADRARRPAPQRPRSRPARARRPRRRPSLSEVVARIERRRRSRASQQAGPGPAGAAPTCRAPALFRWECGPCGEIAWVEGAPRGALIGRSIALAQDHDGRPRRRGCRRAPSPCARRSATLLLSLPRRRAGGGRMEDQRRAGIRAGRRALRRISRDRAARPAAAVGAADASPRSPDRPRIRCASWSTRSRRR